MDVLTVTWGSFSKLPMDANKAEADGWTMTKSCDGKK